MIELKRCPICNEEVKLMFLNCETCEAIVWDESVGNVETWFRCYGCDSDFYHYEPIDIPEKQIKWWNTRKSMERIVERLEHFNEEVFVRANGRANGKSIAYGYSKGIEKALMIVKEEGGLNE